MTQLQTSATSLTARRQKHRSHALTIRRWFGIDRRDRRARPPDVDELLLARVLPRPGQITLICGPSGAGKSSLLRHLRDRIESQRRCIDLARLRLPVDRAVIDCFDSLDIEHALASLSRVGLAEAWCYLKKPLELSDGQRWRLRMALALHCADIRRRHLANTVLVCDEFAALLDRVTASIVARALRKCVYSMPHRLSAIVATSHDDLIGALRPDRIARCDFGNVEFSADFLERQT